MDFKDWQIFKIGSVLQIGSFSALVHRDSWTVGSRTGGLTVDDFWSKAMVGWLSCRSMADFRGLVIEA